MDPTAESILTSIKKLLGIEETYDHFDPDIIIHINTAFSILQQLGVGPEGGFRITDKTSSWGEYTSDLKKLNMVRDYVYMKVRLIFDPPSAGTVVEAYKELISETEWRLNVAVDPKEENVL